MRTKGMVFAGVLAFGTAMAALPATAALCPGSGDINICKSLVGTGTQFTHYTDPFSEDDGFLSIQENVLNESAEPWTHYLITLQSLNPLTGLWEDSDDFDGIDFSGSLLSVSVDGVEQAAGWTGSVIFSPIDRIELLFTGLSILPGQVLTLQFTVADFTSREWRLAQYATTVPAPLPGAALLFGSAVAGLAAFRRRR